MHYYYGYSLEQEDRDIYKKLIKMHSNTPHALFYQFFLTAPMHMGVSKLSDMEINKIKKYCAKHKIKMVVHSSYMINIARKPNLITDETKKLKISWWVKNLLDELYYASLLGAIGCVLHLGKQTDYTKKQAIKNSLDTLHYVLEHKPKDIKIILETSSGQGSEMFYKVEELSTFYKKIKKAYRKDIYFCVDTCHIFAAGYDLSQENGFEDYIKKFDKLIGLDSLGMVHLNDSKNELGSNVDRHASWGEGHIGIENIYKIMEFCLKKHIPIMLETPRDTHNKELHLIDQLAKKL